MSLVDLVLIGLALVFALSGFRQGLLVSATSFLGFLGGAVLGAQLSGPVADRIDGSNVTRVFAALVVVLAGAQGRNVGQTCQAARMANPAQLVRDLYESYQARDWARAGRLLHPAAELSMPATAERLVGRDAVLALQVDYPEPWGNLTVLRVVADGSGPTAVAEIEVVGPSETFRCAAFWQVDEELLHRGVEYWVTVGGEQPPPR